MHKYTQENEFSNIYKIEAKYLQNISFDYILCNNLCKISILILLQFENV